MVMMILQEIRLLPLIKIKYFNALIDNKSFFDRSVKNKQEAHEKLVEKARNDDYTTGNLSVYLYHQKYYKLFSNNLSRQPNTSSPRQINFTGKLEEHDGATIFFNAEKQQKTILNFSFD